MGGRTRAIRRGRSGTGWRRRGGGAKGADPRGPVRDRLAAAGVTINGLCVLHEEPDLLQSYSNEVIGGPGAFVLQCQDFSQFAEAMRQKLAKEIAGARVSMVG